MCTVVFIPGKDGYYFASLRDEDPMRRRALLPAVYNDDNIRYLSPLDPVGGGTWIGVNECGHVIILLNGGFNDHIRKQEYAKSRGAIVKELLSDEMPVIAWSLMDLNRIEPFTLIVWVDEKLFQLVWDGEKKHRIHLSSKTPHIFSSATLYNEVHANERKRLFNNWIMTEPFVTALSLSVFFATASTDTQHGFMINRSEKVKTLSYTFITIKSQDGVEFNYHDLSTNAVDRSTIDLQANERPVLHA